MQIIIAGFLSICAIHDLYSKTIPAIWIWGSLGLALVYRLTMIILGQGTVIESILCLVPGIFLMILSYWGKAVGSGDGWLIMAVGLVLELEALIRVLLYSFLAAGLFSIGYMLKAHKNRKDTIPFVPFLFLGMLLYVWGDV